MTHFKRLTLERLMSYYRFLADLTDSGPLPTITSAQVANALSIDPTQVRKDFAAVGLRGRGRLGFDVNEVRRVLRTALGFEQKHEAVLIGTGYFGSMLLAYPGFARYGLKIVAAFDDDPQVMNGQVAGLPVRPLQAMRRYIKRHRIRLVILAPPTRVSAQLVNRLASAGVKAIWNFAPTQLSGPPGVLVRNEQHFSIGLGEITYHLKQ